MLKPIIVVVPLLLVASVAVISSQDWFFGESDTPDSRETLNQTATPAPQAAEPTYKTRSISPTTKRRASGGTGLNLVQQTSGTVCETPSGSCTVPDRPINAPCQCGDTWGQITR
ncbi:hypothetical protein R3X27_14930 [Tropicimonas sp. TH_r6]|uniref:hypothetical protein n=1 Tax=Tropicimonas sp. TH_r6 TaxID=3082085 RepID=UPI002953CB94|nr:hypothetical protein [Tropicimonas sp. TH_r6]MDV7143980.1 hypothetical protein [Tropicimonas sp. TH_r6]